MKKIISPTIHAQIDLALVELAFQPLLLKCSEHFPHDTVTLTVKKTKSCGQEIVECYVSSKEQVTWAEQSACTEAKMDRSRGDVACCRFEILGGKYLYVHSIGVHPMYERKGIGTATTDSLQELGSEMHLEKGSSIFLYAAHDEILAWSNSKGWIINTSLFGESDKTFKESLRNGTFSRPDDISLKKKTEKARDTYTQKSKGKYLGDFNENVILLLK